MRKVEKKRPRVKCFLRISQNDGLLTSNVAFLLKIPHPDLDEFVGGNRKGIALTSIPRGYWTRKPRSERYF